MRSHILLLIIPLLTQCGWEDENVNPKADILGKWSLVEVYRLSDSRSVLQSGGSTFHFNKHKLTIAGETPLLTEGEFNYVISYENYFDSSQEEPRSNILIVNEEKFIIQFGSNQHAGEFLELISYSDGKIYYHLNRL